ncbi:hydrogenase expression/formation protein HypE [Sulfurisphaera javensis]|uniref:Hydrogenase expression/formation protein HypE n=1 Tax=Sulfurisphaera javensis TaxID=2049879 RepID=A0AAT9GV09_9CREN
MSQTILISHGNGGKETQQLLQRLIFSKLPSSLKKTIDGVGLDFPDDGAVIGKLVIATDSHTVYPYFFPGGSIGKLAVNGTINDVVMMNAKPIAMLDSIVVAEGFPLNDLEKIIDDMLSVLKENNIPLVGGDFKVVPSSSMKDIVINTVGIGITENPLVDKIRPEDEIIVTGPIGVHGSLIAALQYGIQTNLQSDTKPLIKLLDVFDKFKGYIHAARDPTRGGLAATLNEWVANTEYMIVIDENKLNIPEEVKAISDVTGLDPLVLANEGIAVLSVSPQVSKDVLKELDSLGFTPSIIGKVISPENPNNKALVVVKTVIGGAKILEMPTGDIVPRIC